MANNARIKSLIAYSPLRTKRKIRYTSIAFKIWAVSFLLIIITIGALGVIWRTKEYGSISFKSLILLLLLIGIALAVVWAWWGILRGK